MGILVVAYNAASTLQHVLSRIPADFRPRITAILVSDDASTDATYLVGLGYQSLEPDLPLTVIRQEHNLGYGGNQKVGYRWAIDHDLDVVVLLHGDGQYAPELLPDIVRPLEAGSCDAVMGSRMLQQGSARAGGMPLYKYVGNRILTTYENAVVGTELSEWHSGYRAYRVSALADIPFERNDNGFAFDTEVIVQLVEAGKHVCEVPIPTYYGDEISHVNGMAYAWDITRYVTRYRLHKMGFGTGELAFASQDYELKADAHSSHGLLAARLANSSPLRVLDLGCGDGSVGARLAAAGHDVVGVDRVANDDARRRLAEFVVADLDDGLPTEVGTDFDVVLCADVLEHLRRPEDLLDELRSRVRPGGRVLASIPNFAHWYPRVRVATGRFDYDRRGILDRTHLRFFTRRSFERMAAEAGWAARSVDRTGLPLDVAARDATSAGADRGAGGATAPSAPRTAVSRLDRMLVGLWPSLFAYQYIFEMTPLPDPLRK
ncbi:MAG: methyltransferase domain-containing protein [Acidimicrobiia bacterium]|nr:methyltransferase domain-containing protein [Acidimicrobiia bacterium]